MILQKLVIVRSKRKYVSVLAILKKHDSITFTEIGIMKKKKDI